MPLTKSQFSSNSDLQAMVDLMLASPASGLGGVALPYQLGSWATLAPDNIALWRNRTGKLVGFAFIQIPFQMLIYAVHPEVPAIFFETGLLPWVIQRGQVLADLQAGPFALDIWAGPSQPQLIPVLEQHGFKRTENAKVFLSRPLRGPVALPELPPGFSLRPLAGPSEVAAATALLCRAFQLTSFTFGWRQRLMGMPQYDPELDIVVIAPDGQLAAFCLGWLHPGESVGQIEPMATHPAYQRLGLGRAALREGLRRVQGKGATAVIVGTSADNHASRRLYESAGFRRQEQLAGYQQIFRPARS